MRPLDRTSLVTLDDLRERAVEHLYVLELPDGGIELRESLHNEVVVFGYTRIFDLVQACGNGQPFARLTLADLGRLAADLPRPLLIAWDAWLPEGHRYPVPERSAAVDLPAPDPLDEDPMMLIPTRPDDGSQDVTVELINDENGYVVLCAWTSWWQLIHGAGVYQAWRRTRLSRLQRIAHAVEADRVMFDPVLPPRSRHRAVVVNWSRGRW